MRTSEAAASLRSRRSRPRAILLFFAAVGCTQPIPRNQVSDFLIKDFMLPDYRPDEDALSRVHHRISPSNAAAAALGDSAGAYAGGFNQDWHASAGALIGDGGGAFAMQSIAHASTEAPLPADYSSRFLGVPVITVDPNAGVTVGLMPIALFRETDRITDIWAPQLTYNAIDGEGALWRARRYFRDDTKFEIDAGSTTNGAHNYDIQYRQAAIGLYHLFFFRARVRYITELNDRFFGLGNDSDKDAESNYSFRRTEGLAALGIELPRSLSFAIPVRVEFAELLSSSRTGPKHISNLPSARESFPDVPGMSERVNLLSHRFTLTLDTRDKPSATTSGFLLEGYYEIGDSTLASDFAFAKGGFTAQGVVSYLDDAFATAGRFTARFVGGRHVPFFEQTALGGKTDATSITGKMSLRGYGDGRFIDKNGFMLGLEERWNFLPRVQDFVARLFDKRLFDENCTLQVAFFAECGRVFSGGQTFNFGSIKGDIGASIRLIVPESDIVLSIDEGVSKEGPNTFVDLGYTF